MGSGVERKAGDGTEFVAETLLPIIDCSKSTARALLRDYKVLNLRVPQHDLVHCLVSG